MPCLFHKRFGQFFAMKLLFVAVLVAVGTAAALPDDSATRNIRSKAHRELKIQQIRRGKDKAGPVFSNGKIDNTLVQRESRTSTGRVVECSGYGDIIDVPANSGVTFQSANFSSAGRYPSPDDCSRYFRAAAGYSLVIIPYTIQLASYQDILYFGRGRSDVTGWPSNGTTVGHYNGVGGPTTGSLSHYDRVDIQWDFLIADFDANSNNALNGYRGFDFDIISVPLNASAFSTPSTWTTASWVTEPPGNGPQCLQDSYVSTDGYYSFQSPNHPDSNYPNDWDCTTYIYTSSNRQLSIYKNHVDLEQYYDNLYLIDAYTGRRLANITGDGYDVTWPVRSDSNAVYAIFLTDSSETAHGFALDFYSVVLEQQTTTPSYWYPSTTSRPAPWSPTPNTTTTTYTYNSGSTSTTTVQTVTTTATSTVITDTRTSTYTYNSAEWSKLPKDKNGLYIFN